MSQQNVYIDLNSIQSGEGITELTVVYNATDVEATGLGLRIHYDSSQLSVNGISNVLQSNLIFAYDTPSLDSQDFDNDADTDQYIDLAWATADGDWPGFAPVNLVTVSFFDAILEETTINFSASSYAVGFEFVGQSYQLNAASDDVSPVVTSSDTVSVDENIGESQVVYTASSDASSTVTYSLVDDAVYTTTVPSVDAPDNTQLVSVASYSSQDANGQITVKVNYNADSDQLTGLGLRIHFDSSVLTVADINNVLDQDLINTDSDAQADTDNLDGNASTDSYVTVAWASLDGDWPGEALPGELLTLVFDVADDAAGSTDIGFSTSSTPVGYGFSGDAIAIDLMESPLSIDSATGEVTLSDNPDFEAQDSYAFTVIATDAAGNVSAPQAVTLSINNLDEVAPSITSGATADAINENSGAGQVIYTATAYDSADFSDGVTYSLVDDAVYTTTVPSVDAPANTQLVSVASYSSQDANGQITVKVNYNADSDQLTGLGLRIHFDSSVLTVADINNVLDQDLINTDSDAQADTDNLDGNASTDSYVTVAWASLGGDWPGEALAW
jgi:hypothetical protein